MRRHIALLIVGGLELGCGREGADLLLSVAQDSGATDAFTTCAGFAAKFENSAYLRVPRPIQDDFTIEAWIKIASSLDGANFWEGNGLVYADYARPTEGGGADDFGTSVLSGKFAFGTGNPDTTIVTSSDVAVGQWVHVAATRNKATGENRVLVNGVLENSVMTSQHNSLTAQPTMRIGNTLANRYYVGLMDEVRLWDIVRSESDLASDMHRVLFGDEPGLVAYWRFDDPGGPIAADSSTRGAHATVFGPLEWVVSDAPLCPTGP